MLTDNNLPSESFKHIHGCFSLEIEEFVFSHSRKGIFALRDHTPPDAVITGRKMKQQSPKTERRQECRGRWGTEVSHPRPSRPRIHGICIWHRLVNQRHLEVEAFVVCREPCTCQGQAGVPGPGPSLLSAGAL